MLVTVRRNRLRGFMSKHLKNLSACVLIILTFLFVNFIINTFDLLMTSEESLPPTDSREFGGTLNTIFGRLAVFQLAYFLLSLLYTYLFRWIGFSTTIGLVLIKYVMIPLFETGVTVSMFVWSRALSYLVSTFCGGLLGIQIKRWQEGKRVEM